MTKYRAVYRNESSSATFSAPVEKTPDGSWVMHSADGQQLPIHLTFNDDAAGTLVFSHYREDPEPEDLRLHVEPRQPGQSSFRQLQEARAAHVDQERKARGEARAHVQNVLPDPAKVAQARDLNNQYAALKNRHGIKNQ